MHKRTDYEHQELDLDNNYYWFMNSDVQYPNKEPLLKDFISWFRKNEVNNGFYWKGTALYFTFKGVKYWLSWTFYDKEYLDTAVVKLKALGAENIQLNYGEPD